MFFVWKARALSTKYGVGVFDVSWKADLEEAMGDAVSDGQDGNSTVFVSVEIDDQTFPADTNPTTRVRGRRRLQEVGLMCHVPVSARVGAENTLYSSTNYLELQYLYVPSFRGQEGSINVCVCEFNDSLAVFPPGPGIPVRPGNSR